MRKIQIAFFAALFMLTFAACSKEEQKKADEAPVCQTIEFHINWSDMSEDIFNNFKITVSGKDFNGESFTGDIAAVYGGYKFVKENVNIDNIDDNCPFTYKIAVEDRDGSGDESKEYSYQFKMQVYAVFKDADGKELYTGSAEESTKDIIVNADFAKSPKVQGFEKFKKLVSAAIDSDERTYVFFRGQSSYTGEYFFSHSTK